MARPINLDDVTTINELQRVARGHFFDKDTMRFFRSKVYDGFKRTADGVVFITSERDVMGGEPRAYTLRLLDADGDVSTVGDFQAFASLKAAQRALIRLDGTWQR